MRLCCAASPAIYVRKAPLARANYKIYIKSRLPAPLNVSGGRRGPVLQNRKGLRQVRAAVPVRSAVLQYPLDRGVVGVIDLRDFINIDLNHQLDPTSPAATQLPRRHERRCPLGSAAVDLNVNRRQRRI